MKWEYMIVIIGDIVNSKQLKSEEREHVQTLLSEQIENINSESESIEAPYTITLGDEFQAVYSDAATLLDDCWKLLAELHPVGIRFSASIGTIVTPINKEQAIGMDGPAFHAAREGIEELKKTGYSFSVRIEKKEAEIVTQPVLNLINSSLKLLSGEMESWKKIRYQILVMLNRGMAVKEIARELAISESAVYKNRDDGDLALVIELKNNIQILLNREMEGRWKS